jgi:peptidoglycan/LPS O-acetylase OafA/YrhL
MVGVDIFFAISGLLICSRLLNEERRNGAISLKSFYVRRAIRILPPAILYLLTALFLSHFALIQVSARECLTSLLFLRNYPSLIGNAGWYTGHFWSLALEEQFYFLLPLLLVLSPKRYRVPTLTFMVVAITVHRTLALRALPWSHIGYHAGIRMDSLFIPALLAVLMSQVDPSRQLYKYLRLWPLLTLALVCVTPFGENTSWHASVISILASCMILGATLHPSNVLGKLLEWNWLKYIGRISYGLYLWQQMFFTQHFPPGSSLPILTTWPVRMGMTFGCAITSYYILERPLMRWGHRFATSLIHARNRPPSAEATAHHSDSLKR